MAIRRHLLLVPTRDKKALAKALEGVDAAPPAQAGAWTWVSASAWTESHADLRERLERMNRPFLLFSTFDDEGWSLAAKGSSGSVEEATHEFAKDWRAGGKGAAKRIDNLAEMIRSVATAADPKSLTETLSGRALSETEMESDLGDLPRLLQVLGAEGIVEIPQAPPPMKQQVAKPTGAQALLAGHEGRPRSEVEGVSVESAHAADLAAIALFCDPDCLLALVARGNDLPEVKLDIPCKIGRHDSALMVEAEGGIGLKFNVIDRAARQLADCPGLTELTIVSGRKRGGKDIAWHRYKGKVREGEWRLEEATPPVDGVTLAVAVALIGQRRIAGPVECVTDAEASAVAERCAKSLYIPPDKAPTAKGSQLQTAEGTRLYVLMEVFRLRYAKVWETSAAQKAEQAEMKRWDWLEKKLEDLVDRNQV